NLLRHAIAPTVLLVFLAVNCPAQWRVPPSGSGMFPSVGAGREPSLEERRRARLGALKTRKAALERYLQTVDAASPEFKAVAEHVRALEAEIEAASRELTAGAPPAPFAGGLLHASAPAPPRPASGTPPRAYQQNLPVFELSVPAHGATRQSRQPLLAWTRDRQPNRNYTITAFVVEVSENSTTNPDGTFTTTVFTNELAPTGRDMSVSVPEKTAAGDNILEEGERYFWHVLARYIPQGGTPVPGVPTKYLPVGGTLNPDGTFTPAGGAAALPLPDQPLAPPMRSPFSFQTTFAPFAFLSKRGLHLQRAVTGPDKGEGAEFAFLRSFGENTVYTANFALIYKKDLSDHISFGSFQTSVEGRLTSDESQAEDAWRFRALLNLNPRVGSFKVLHFDLGGKLETDQDFETRKLSGEFTFTPTLRSLRIGIPTPPEPSSPVQFRWRPYFGLDVGRTFRRGESNETEETIFRLRPRLRARTRLNFLRIPLNFNDVYVYVDDTFYYLPLEKTKKRYNFFESGLQFEVTGNFGFGLTFQNGESAPQFRRVRTLGGVLTIRFGDSESER
ncbi:MAG TPA: hypothetical protein VEQ42_06615, partial [Pyrinomonadaceae bacterium]|nr:hypothetical protein [Pyrinomonadaceae bacterium]